MKSRGLFVTDIHARGDEKVSLRKDDFLKAIVAKLREAMNIAKEEKLDYVVIGGDLFDKWDPAASVQNALINVFMHDDDGNDWPFKKYVVVGNHDLYGYVWEKFHQAAIKNMIDARVLTKLDEDKELGLYGGHYDHSVEAGKYMSDMPIWYVHHFIMPQPFIGSHYLIGDMKVSPSTKAVISGHYHPGYPIKKRKDGVIFANPGSLARNSISDMKHIVSVAIVSLDGDEVKVEYRPLKSAAPYEEIFEIADQKAEDHNPVDVEAFMGVIDSAREMIKEGSDSVELLSHLGSELGINESIIEEAKRRVLKAREGR